MRYFFHFDRWAAGVAAIMLLCACAQEKVEDGISNRTCTFSATLETPVQDTKALVPDVVSFRWTAQDDIAVWLNGQKMFMTFPLVSSDGSSAVFKRDLPNGAAPGYAAVYPASAVVDFLPFFQTLTVRYPDTYDWSEDGLVAPPMLARLPENASQGASLDFKHLGGLLRITLTDIPNSARQLVLSVPGKRISGNFQLDLSQADAPTVYAEDDLNDGTVTIRFSEAQLRSKMSFGIPLPANVYNHFSIKLRDEFGNDIQTIKQVTTSQNVNEIGRATLLAMPSIPAGNNSLNISTALVDATSSTLAFKFSTTNFQDLLTDRIEEWTVSLYRDANCNDLVVRWRIPRSVYQLTGANWDPRFIFSGLERNTTYWFTASCGGTESQPISAKTKSFSPVLLSSFAAGSAKAGDVILNEDFKDFVWGGSWWNKCYAAGYVSNNTKDNNMADDATIAPASGPNPLAVNKHAIVNSSTPFRLMHVYAHKNSDTENGLIKNTSLKDWNMFTYTEGWEAVRMAAGHVVIGHSPQTNADIGGYFAPALSCLSKKATIKVTFKGMYYGNMSAAYGALYVLPGEKMSQINVKNNGGCLAKVGSTASYDGQWIYENCLVKKANFTLTGSVQTFTFTLTGITVGSRIGFCNDIDKTTTGTQHRWLLDDVKMEIVNYEN